MKKITKTQKIGVSAIILLLSVTAGYIIFLKHIYALQEELAKVNVELANVDKLEVSKIETVDLLNKSKEQREEVSKYFVSIEDPTPFLELIEALANDADVILEVETLSPYTQDKSKISDSYEKEKIVLTVEGKWENIFHLISLLEHMPYVVTISNTSFAIENNSVSDEWNGQIELLYSVM